MGIMGSLSLLAAGGRTCRLWGSNANSFLPNLFHFWVFWVFCLLHNGFLSIKWRFVVVICYLGCDAYFQTSTEVLMSIIFWIDAWTNVAVYVPLFTNTCGNALINVCFVKKIFHNFCCFRSQFISWDLVQQIYWFVVLVIIVFSHFRFFLSDCDVVCWETHLKLVDALFGKNLSMNTNDN